MILSEGELRYVILLLRDMFTTKMCIHEWFIIYTSQPYDGFAILLSFTNIIIISAEFNICNSYTTHKRS